MPDFTIETTYHLPVWRHRTYSADSVAAACRLAIEDQEWSAGKFDHDSAGESFVTGIWPGSDSAYSSSSIPVPSHFAETVQRKAEHFETLLSLLKAVVAEIREGTAPTNGWVARASRAVALGEAVLAGAREPDGSVGGNVLGGDADA